MSNSRVSSDSEVGPTGLPLPSAFLRELERALRTIRYGAIELVIHDGQVVQLERREKVRIDAEVTRRS